LAILLPESEPVEIHHVSSHWGNAHNVCFLASESEHPGTGTSDQQRRMWPLDRPGACHLINLIVLTSKGERLATPATFDHGDRFLEPTHSDPGRVEAKPGCDILLLDPAGSDSKLEPTI